MQRDIDIQKAFGPDILNSYVRQGSKLRATVTSLSGIKENLKTFTASSGNGASCFLEDHHSGDWVDALAEVLGDPEEKQVVANSLAYAIGRKTDELIIDALDESGHHIGARDRGFTLGRALEAREALTNARAPADGRMTAIVGWRQWSELLAIPDFANAGYLSMEELPWKGTQAKRWLGALWMPHSGLSKVGGERLCHWYHREAVGHASGDLVRVESSWNSDRQAHYLTTTMAQGACVAVPNWVATLPCREDAQ